MANLMTRDFLTVNEMDAGRKALQDQQIVQGQIGNMRSGLAWQSDSMDLEEKKQQAAERQVIAQAELDAVKNFAPQLAGGQPAPVQQPASQQPAAPVQTQPNETPQPGVPPVAQQPAAPAQAAPAAQNIPTTQVDSTPAAAADQPTPNQPTSQAPAAAAPAQAAPATPAPTAPVAKTPQQVEETLRSTPVIGGQINKLSDTILGAREKIVQQLLQEGKIRPATAEAYLQQIADARNKQLTAAVTLQEKIAKIETENTNAKEKKVKIAAEIRAAGDNFANEVYQTLKSGDTVGATQLAKEYGIQFDPEDPRSLAQLEMRARRSADFKAAQEEQRKADKETRESTAIATKDLPDGYFRKSANDPQVYKIDNTGKLTPVSTEEVFAASKMKAKAGAATTVNNAPGSAVNATAAPGDISAIVVDKQGNRKLDPAVVKNLTASQKAMGNATTILGQIPEITTKVLPEASASGAGALAGKVGEFFGAKGGINEANKRMEQFANSALGVVDSPLMKGAPSEADARRALSVINDPKAPLNVKQQAIENLKGILEDAVKTHNDAIGQYNSETRERLKGLGITPATVKGQSPQGNNPAASGKTPIVRDQATYDALPSGTIFLDVNGKQARKP